LEKTPDLFVFYEDFILFCIFVVLGNGQIVVGYN